MQVPRYWMLIERVQVKFVLLLLYYCNYFYSVVFLIMNVDQIYVFDQTLV